jgi:hypothetical protein
MEVDYARISSPNQRMDRVNRFGVLPRISRGTQRCYHNKDSLRAPTVTKIRRVLGLAAQPSGLDEDRLSSSTTMSLPSLKAATTQER